MGGKKKKKKTKNLSFSKQRRQIIGSVFNEHLNPFTHNLKWWHFQILQLEELWSSMCLMFLIGVYKYSTNETHHFGEGIARRLWSTAIPPRLPNGAYDPPQPALASALKNEFSSTWIWIFLPFETRLPFYMKYFCSAWRWGSKRQPRCTLHRFEAWPMTTVYTAQSSLWLNMRNYSNACGKEDCVR